MAKLLFKMLISKNSMEFPSMGLCPKCGAHLKLSTSLFGTFIVCSNPTCDFFKKVKNDEKDRLNN